MSQSNSGAYRVPVRSAGFHPPLFGGVPRGIFIGNLILNILFGMQIGFSKWLILPVLLGGLIQMSFAFCSRQGPYYLRFLISDILYPIEHLEP